MNGFPIAMERHVLFRLGRTALPMTTLYAAFDEATVEYAHGTRTGP